MSESAYVGLPGMGKSYGVVENVIKPSLEQKREVWTNIPMNLEECEKRFGCIPVQFNIEEIAENPNWWTEVFSPGAVLVIDEVWRLWPAGLKANNVRAEDKAFLAEHRHMVGENGQSTEIVLVTQDLSQIASFARALVETTFRVTKLSKIGLDSRYRVDVYFGPVTGASPPVSKRDREIHGKFSKEIFSLYKSHTKSVTGNAGSETRIDKRFKALGGVGIKLGIALGGFCFVAAYFGLQYIGTHYGLIDSTVTKDQQMLPKSPPVSQTPVRVPPEEPVFKFLSRAEVIFISYNAGRFPRIDYRYTVRFDEYEAVFNEAEMAALEYELYPINQCMVKIKGPDYFGVAMCQRSDAQRGWVEQMVSNNADSM